MLNFEQIERYKKKSFYKLLPWIGVSIVLTILVLLLTWQPLPPAICLALFWLAYIQAQRQAAHFASGVYGLPQQAEKEAGDILTYRWVGYRPTFHPYVLVKEGALVMGSDALREMGGPGGLVLYQDSAVVLEKHGTLSRVLIGPKFPDLEPFERVWDVIDLRPQRWVFDVSAITADGIPINYDADVHFQVEPNEEAVLKASLSTWVREAHRTEPDRLMTWTKRVVIGETEGALRSILAHYTLDELLDLEVRERIREELRQKLESFGQKLGVRILDVNLKDLKLRGKVIEQWFETWRAERLRIMNVEIAEGKAVHARRLEAARNKVRQELLESTLKVLQAHAADDKRLSSQLLILSCIEVIKRTAFDLNIFLPADLIKTLDAVRSSMECKDKGTVSS